MTSPGVFFTHIQFTDLSVTKHQPVTAARTLRARKKNVPPPPPPVALAVSLKSARALLIDKKVGEEKKECAASSGWWRGSSGFCFEDNSNVERQVFKNASRKYFTDNCLCVHRLVFL